MMVELQPPTLTVPVTMQELVLRHQMQSQQLLEKLPALTDSISILSHAVLPVFVHKCLHILLANVLLSFQLLVIPSIYAPSMLM